jgi:hypothetical protein
VFITIGPCQVTGSAIGFTGDQQKPDAIVARLDHHFVAPVKKHEAAVVRLGGSRCVQPPYRLCRHRNAENEPYSPGLRIGRGAQSYSWVEFVVLI